MSLNDDITETIEKDDADNHDTDNTVADTIAINNEDELKKETNTDEIKPETNKNPTLEKECFENEKKQKRLENLTFYNFLSKNYFVVIIAFICLYFISNNFIYGILTFIATHVLFYSVHVSTHKHNNLFTKIHEYHHSHTNFLSHISQVLLELAILSLIFLPFYLGGGSNCMSNKLEMYVLVLAGLLYTSVHNINYGCFRVNNVHSIHHMRRITNYGPDVCDVVFDSKDKLNNEPENIFHFIPNLIILTLLLMVIKSEKILQFSTLKRIGSYFISFNFLFFFAFSIYLYKKENIPVSLYNIFVGTRTPNDY